MRTSDDETKWLPFTMSTEPCCTSAKLIVLDEIETISGTGRALPHKGVESVVAACKEHESKQDGEGQAESARRHGDTPFR
jgi:hypothetical protein